MARIISICTSRTKNIPKEGYCLSPSFSPKMETIGHTSTIARLRRHGTARFRLHECGRSHGRRVCRGPKQVYEYDAHAQRLVRASIGEAGYNNDGKTPVYDTVLAVGPEGAGQLPQPYSVRDSPTGITSVLVPEDGTVFFESPTALTPSALNDQLDAHEVPVPNVYEYKSGKIQSAFRWPGCLDDIRQPRGEADWIESGSGADLFFTTSDSLVPQDGDTQLYLMMWM